MGDGITDRRDTVTEPLLGLCDNESHSPGEDWEAHPKREDCVNWVKAEELKPYQLTSSGHTKEEIAAKRAAFEAKRAKRVDLDKEAFLLWWFSTVLCFRPGWMLTRAIRDGMAALRW